MSVRKAVWIEHGVSTKKPASLFRGVVTEVELDYFISDILI